MTEDKRKTDMYTGFAHNFHLHRWCGERESQGDSSLRMNKGSAEDDPEMNRGTAHATISTMSGKTHGHETHQHKPTKNYCFVCGPDNPEGMHLQFTLDEERRTFVCHFTLPKRFTGPPGHCHGGIIASILDDAMGKPNKLRDVVAVTKEMTVEYLKPVPLEKPLRVEGREVSVHGRQHINAAEIFNEQGEVLARSKGIFVAIDPEKMFGKFVER